MIHSENYRFPLILLSQTPFPTDSVDCFATHLWLGRIYTLAMQSFSLGPGHPMLQGSSNCRTLVANSLQGSLWSQIHSHLDACGKTSGDLLFLHPFRL